MELIETDSTDLIRIADALQRQVLEIDVQLLDARKSRNVMMARLDEVLTELKLRGQIARDIDQECA